MNVTNDETMLQILQCGNVDTYQTMFSEPADNLSCVVVALFSGECPLAFSSLPLEKMKLKDNLLKVL